MPLAMSDVEPPLATMTAILTSVGVSAAQPKAARWTRWLRRPRLTPWGRAGLGPLDVPAGLQALVAADGLVQGGPGVLFPATLGQRDGQVLQCGRQFGGRPERPVVRDSFAERIGIGLKESAASQAGRGRPGRIGLRRGLRLTGPRRGLRHRPVARGQREPDQIWQPLVDQRHLPVAPRQHPG